MLENSTATSAELSIGQGLKKQSDTVWAHADSSQLAAEGGVSEAASTAAPKEPGSCGMGVPPGASPSSLQEDPKPVFSARKAKAFVSLLIHLPSVAATMALLGLYIAAIPWAPPGPSSSVLSALQFAAKVHESLIVTSITSIVFHRLRYELMSARGISFGLLAASFQLGSLGYLASPEFWATTNWRTRIGSYQLHTVLLIVASAVLVLACGPSSAIAIIPQSGLWPVPGLATQQDPRDGDTAVLGEAYIGAEYSDLYPTLLDFPPGAGQFGTYCNKLSLVPCMAGGWPYIFAYLSGTFVADLTFDLTTATGAGTNLTANISIPATHGARVLSGQAQTWPVDNGPGSPEGANFTRYIFSNTLAYATTPVDFLISAMNWQFDRLQQESLHPSAQLQLGHPLSGPPLAWKQPQVFLQCQQLKLLLTSANSTNASVEFPSGIHPSFNLPLASFLAPLYSECLSSAGCSEGNITFMDWADHIPFPVSASTVSTLDISNATSFGVILGLNVEIEVCIVEAFWTDFSSMVVNTTVAGLPPSTYIGLDATSLQSNSHAANVGQLITMDASLPNSENMLGAQIQFPDPRADPFGLTVGMALAQQCQGYLLCNSFSLALLLADGLARLQAKYDYVFLSTDAGGRPVFLDEYVVNSQSATGPHYSWTPVADTNMIVHAENWTHNASVHSTQLQNTTIFTEIPMTVYEQTYGYRFEGPLTFLAWAVLLSHVAIVSAHVAIVVFGRPWSSSAWSGLGELLALVHHSMPSKLLENTSSGVDKSSTWRLTAAVRETQSGDALEVVLFDERTTGRTASSTINKRTGRLPRPERRYG